MLNVPYDPKQTTKCCVADEPPYFLPNVSLSDSMGASEQILRLPSKPSNLNNHRIISSGNGSSTDDFKSVIDDLTIENKRLKERLRKLERNSKVPLEKDKLFEVKIHSLPSRKRKELEDTLRAFTSGLNCSVGTADRQGLRIATTGSSPYTLLNSARSACKHASSSSTSFSRPVDSAYASMSQSGPTSSSNIHHITLKGKSVPQQQIGEEQKVQSFLHNIPKGFFPRHSAIMTERQKKKLVVLRLEQLFVGKKGVVGGAHSQPIQQQEVSRSAAQADRDADSGPVRKEGVREAKIHHWDPDVSRPGNLHDEPSRDTQMETSYSSDEVSADQSSLEQRPTRPLDLDPDRAQVPSENADYLRHLGLSTPNFSSYDSTDSAADDEGWIYLNLLINMAQLHIINVTPEFVRAAVSEVSEKFQISSDGKKLRWRGGSSGTQLSSDSGTSSARNQSPQNSDNPDEKLKRRKVNTGRFVSVPVDVQHPTSNGTNLLQYKPLFHHQPSDTSMLDSSEDDSVFDYNHDTRSGTAAFSSIPRKATTHSSPGTPRKQRIDGPIVFYNGATFCTDLSGDPGITPCGTSVEGSVSMQVSPNPRHTFSSTTSGSILSTRPFKDVKSFKEPLARQRTPDLFKADSKEGEDYFNEQSLDYSSRMMSLQSFEASGLGGTQPADHFALGVETRRTKTSTPIPTKLSRFSAPGSNARRFAHSIPEQSLQSFFRSGSQDTDEFLTRHLASMAALDSPSPSFHVSKTLQSLPIKSEVISTRFIRLEPSALPPPSGYYATLSSSDGESGDSSTSGGLSHLRHYTVVGNSELDRDESPSVEMAEDEEEEEDDDESEESEESEESIDMLAHARELDPETVREQEQEFEMVVDDGNHGNLEVPVSSLLATLNSSGNKYWGEESEDESEEESDSE